MFNVCPDCGEYSEEKSIDPNGPVAICPYCGHRHPFVQLPLFIITGASGSGKTTVCQELATHMTQCVFMESDILWRTEFATPDDNYRSYRNLWLRLAKNISQAGRPVVLCGSAIPEQFESCPERRYFTTIHYLALVCAPEVLKQRLQSRPQWRQSSSLTFIKQMLDFNAWFMDHARQTKPPITLLNNTRLSIDETSEKIADWITAHI